jgi:catechol 2,3-dioxygenase-like lactoylglutathione lyase family enzyme
MSTTKTRLSTLSLVCIPSPEQDQAIEFYEKLGFEKRTDTPFGGGYRWIEVYLPNDATGIALAPPPPSGGEHEGVQTGVTLQTQDIDTTYAEFKALGVDVDDEVSRMGDPIPPMFWFRDPNGNSLIVVEVQA